MDDSQACPQQADLVPARRLHRMAPALLIAAGSFANPRPACAILAAGVQQRLVTPDQLHAALDAMPKLRHYRVLRLAIHDISQGTQALSEIDFRRPCKRNNLPMPRSQAVRVQADGTRRYLDAEWDLPSDRVLAAEVDGALHLVPRSWTDDQLRQNEVVLGGTTVLRYPSVIVRAGDPIVADQLRRGLRLPHQ